MAIIEKIKNNYDKIKNSIKESIFSKNKSIIRFSEFNKKSTIHKISITTFVNMLFALPAVIIFSTPDINGIHHALQSLSTFFSVFLFANLLTFSGIKLISYLIQKYKDKFFPKFQPAFTVKEDETKAEYFGSGFINRIKEFFVSTFSVAASFIPFLLLATIAISLFNIVEGGLSSFNFLSLIELDAILLITLTTVTSLTIYSFKGLLCLKDKLFKILNKKDEELKETKQEESYVPKRAFPAEEFAVSLHNDFKKSNDINAYEELKVMTKELPVKTKD